MTRTRRSCRRLQLVEQRAASAAQVVDVADLEPVPGRVLHLGPRSTGRRPAPDCAAPERGRPLRVGARAAAASGRPPRSASAPAGTARSRAAAARPRPASGAAGANACRCRPRPARRRRRRAAPGRGTRTAAGSRWRATTRSGSITRPSVSSTPSRREPGDVRHRGDRAVARGSRRAGCWRSGGSRTTLWSGAGRPNRVRSPTVSRSVRWNSHWRSRSGSRSASTRSLTWSAGRPKTYFGAYQ